MLIKSIPNIVPILLRSVAAWPEDIVAIQEPALYEAEGSLPGLVGELEQLCFARLLPTYDDMRLQYSLTVSGQGAHDWYGVDVHTNVVARLLVH